MIPGRGPTTASVDLQVSGENNAEILEGLQEPVVTNLDVKHVPEDGDTEDAERVRVGIEVEAREVSLEARMESEPTMTMTDDAEDRLPVYEADVDWGTGRVDTSEWDVSVDTATQVYNNLIEKVSVATKRGTPSVVVVGRPQYRALWVYVSEVHDEAENPEQLVPLRMVVVSGPQLHVEQRNLDVLYENHD